MYIKQGEVVLFEFPYSDLSVLKKRPALVISSDDFNAVSDDVITVAITTQKKLERSQIAIDQIDIDRGELMKKSYVKCGSIITIKKTIILKRVAYLKQKKLEEVLKNIHQILKIK